MVRYYDKSELKSYEVDGQKIEYIIHQTETATWKEAFDMCRALPVGFSLPLPESDAENDALRALTPTSYHIWLGATDENTEGSWEDSSNPGVAIKYTNWNDNEPNNHLHGIDEYEHYAYMRMGTDKKWNDYPKNEELPVKVICQRKAPGSSIENFDKLRLFNWPQYENAAKMTVFGGEAGDTRADHMIDGDEATIWHADCSKNINNDCRNMEQRIVIDFCVRI